MIKEIKICLPVYKLAYSICFVLLLSLAQGISNISEIGIALDADMAVLAIVFCADIYWMEYQGKRWEVFRLYSVKNRKRTIIHRLKIQCLYLCLLSNLGYVCFSWQKPTNTEGVSPALLYVMFLGAVSVSIIFWSTLSMTLVNLCRNIWAGIGISIVLWLIVNSKTGQQLLGKFNIFAFAFRDAGKIEDMGWLLGKGAALLFTFIMLAMNPVILKKRG